MQLFTVGHSNHSIKTFIELLQRHKITALADVRSRPYSRYLPHFCQAQLKDYLEAEKIRYVFLGQELGARPEDQSCYVDGKALYERIAATDLFIEGIQRILNGVKKYRIALMCAEKDPITCHRAILICQHLQKHGLEIYHIKADGNLESQQDLEQRLLIKYGFREVEGNTQTEQSPLFFLGKSEDNIPLEERLTKAYKLQGDAIAYVKKEVIESTTSKELVITKKINIAHSKVEYIESNSILTKASGFMGGFDYTLNPYSGCTFGCTYCYAAFFSKTKDQRESWGYWVQVKNNALELLKKKRKKPLIGTTVYMSSVTDPYQPIENDLKLTRSIIIELLEYHQIHLVIQTRSPLVIRDIDILKQFERIQVNMTITSDNEEVRQVFEPFCSRNDARINAIKKVKEAGIKSCITMTPLLPISDPHKFAKDLLAVKVDKYIVQPFHAERGKFIAGTRQTALNLINEMGWDMPKYHETVKILRDYLPNLKEGKEGFSEL